MRKVFFYIAAWLCSVNVMAQIPYFAGTVGDGKLYAYTSVKARPGINHQETYTTFQYGVGEHFATGVDLYTGFECAYWGTLIRYGTNLCKWFNVGAEVTPSFDLNRSFRFSYLTSALYLNGAITHDSRLFWCSNTWWIVNRDAAATYSNYEYLGYGIPLKSGRSLTPMVGVIHSWRFDADADLAAGCYYSFKQWNLYVWSNDLLKSHPRIVIGLDVIL